MCGSPNVKGCGLSVDYSNPIKGIGFRSSYFGPLLALMGSEVKALAEGI